MALVRPIPLSMPGSSPQPALQRVLFGALHRVLYDGLRPLARRLSSRTLDRLGRVLAVPVGALFVALGGGARRDYLRQLRRSPGLWAQYRFGVREAVARARTNVGYLRPDAGLVERPGAAAWAARDEPSILTSWSAHGLVNVGVWAAGTGARFVRHPVGPEGGPAPEALADPAERWLAEKARVRHETFGDRQIVPGKNPLAYLRALRRGDPLMLFQDVIDPAGEAPLQRLLGLDLPIRTGAVRLARAAGVPLFYLTSGFEDGRVWVDVEGPLPLDERAVLDRIEASIRAEPWRWEHWHLALTSEVPDEPRRPSV